MDKTITIVDAVMGSGKTSAAINFINEAPEEYKFIYITPFLSEIERICNRCKGKNFKSPSDKSGSKTEDLRRLLNKGVNIVTTHSLFHLFDQNIIDLCYAQNYILIMDEVTDVVEPYSDDILSKDDRDNLFKDYIDVDPESGILHWREEASNYDGRFDDVKRLVDMGSLAVYGDQIMVWLFPIKIFEAFSEIYILTYLFKAQMQNYYYGYYDMNYKYLYVEGDNVTNYRFTEKKQIYTSKYNYKDLITIVDDEKLNRIGELESSLSKTWYDKNNNGALMKILKYNTYNFFHNRKNVYENGKWVAATGLDNLWTTFKEYKNKIQGKGYTKSFLSSNARATNEYRERTVIAYLINKYINPVVKQFFVTHGVEVYEDDFALSEMLQFIWRSAIRDGKHITVYIPSKRMRTLLLKWIDSTI